MNHLGLHISFGYLENVYFIVFSAGNNVVQSKILFYISLKWQMDENALKTKKSTATLRMINGVHHISIGH